MSGSSGIVFALRYDKAPHAVRRDPHFAGRTPGAGLGPRAGADPRHAVRHAQGPRGHGRRQPRGLRGAGARESHTAPSLAAALELDADCLDMLLRCSSSAAISSWTAIASRCRRSASGRWSTAPRAISRGSCSGITRSGSSPGISRRWCAPVKGSIFTHADRSGRVGALPESDARNGALRCAGAGQACARETRRGAATGPRRARMACLARRSAVGIRRCGPP